MSYITGFDRSQAVLFPESIDQIIDQDNAVRFIDSFVDSLDLPSLEFKDVRHNINGRPPYHPKDLLKLYLYGYLNKIRASRKLEKECRLNIELMWLMSGLVPDHNTISNFRRDNPKAIKRVFRATVELAKNNDLIRRDTFSWRWDQATGSKLQEEQLQPKENRSTHHLY